MNNLTLEDIARKCGVSRSTVSRVINDHPNVSDKVRKRVEKEIKSTGFRPHAAARALVSQRSWTIGLVLPRSVQSFFTDPYYPRLIQGIAQGCNQNKYTLGLYLLTDTEDEEEIFPRISRRGSLDGILFQSDQMGDQQGRQIRAARSGSGDSGRSSGLVRALSRYDAQPRRTPSALSLLPGCLGAAAATWLDAVAARRAARGRAEEVTGRVDLLDVQPDRVLCF